MSERRNSLFVSRSSLRAGFFLLNISRRVRVRPWEHCSGPGRRPACSRLLTGNTLCPFRSPFPSLQSDRVLVVFLLATSPPRRASPLHTGFPPPLSGRFGPSPYPPAVSGAVTARKRAFTLWVCGGYLVPASVTPWPA